ncbi:hypothetical protein, partial [Microbacterium maritypicum]
QRAAGAAALSERWRAPAPLAGRCVAGLTGAVAVSKWSGVGGRLGCWSVRSEVVEWESSDALSRSRWSGS